MKQLICLIMSILLLITSSIGAARSKYNEEKLSKMNAYTEENKFCEKGQIVFAGDSITELYQQDANFKILETALGKKVYGRGISGDTSDRLLERLEKNVTNIMPSKAIILIGTNDISYGFIQTATVKNIEKILKKIKTDCPQCEIYLQAVYPVNKAIVPIDQSKNTMVGKRSNTHIKTLNKQLKVIAENENVKFIDLTAALSDEKGCFKAEFTYDGLHPTSEGFAAITQELLKILK